jgi:hypothetical protein
MHHLVVYKLICLIQNFLQEQADLSNSDPMTPENKQLFLAKSGKILLACMPLRG